MEKLRKSVQPTKADIERAATLFFARLQAEVDVPRTWSGNSFDDAITFNIEETRKRIARIEDQLRTNSFETQKLRFSKSSYEWVRNGEGYSYELSPPTDRDIGTWEGGRFSQITD